MKLILVQYRPAIRLYKWAVTLKSLGHDVTICFTRACDLGFNWNQFKCVRYEFISDFTKYDRYISFNPCLDISYRDDVKVIQAVGDLRSANEISQKEIQILKMSYKSVFISETQRRFAERLCGKLNSEVYINGVIDELVGEKKPKIKSDKLELVYSGTISNGESHRNIIDKLKAIKDNNDCNIHIYPSFISSVNGYEDFIIHESVSPYDLISELSQYHGGLFLLSSSKAVMNMALPNKIFEYAAAGLNVYSEPYYEVLKHGVAIINNNKIKGKSKIKLMKYDKTLSCVL
jgi:hypothetical protein